LLGFVYYVLTQAGLHDVLAMPAGSYAWVRKADRFRAVISRRLDGFELDELKPGVCSSGATLTRQIATAVTHTMIYLGREKSSGQPRDGWFLGWADLSRTAALGSERL